MTDLAEITEAMIMAAMKAGKRSGALAINARHADIRSMLSVALSEMASNERGPRYDLVVRTGLGPAKARFLGVTQQYAYFRVETEEGKPLVVHANDIEPGRRA